MGKDRAISNLCHPYAPAITLVLPSLKLATPAWACAAPTAMTNAVTRIVLANLSKVKDLVTPWATPTCANALMFATNVARELMVGC